MKALVLFSGGIDSTTCLAMAIDKYGAENVIALSLYYGQRHNKELECAEKVARYYNIKRLQYDVGKIFENSNCSLLSENDNNIPLESYSEQLKKTDGRPVSTYVPYRNGLFLSIATSYAISYGCDVIYYGAHADDAAGNAYPDCSTEFNDAIKTAIKRGSGETVDVIAPFIDRTKAEVVKTGLALNAPYALTWSCYNGKDKACGKCGTCIDRKKAFELNGATDPIEYEA